ncbi:MAG: dihydrodipicolinate reductase [Firmicutes bacterium]|nr:dihydrodipicolinate reductase [Bacillota bacterium]
METVKVILWGLGAMGSGMVRDIVQNKKGIEIVGAIGQNPQKIGKDLGDVLGLEKSKWKHLTWQKRWMHLPKSIM